MQGHVRCMAAGRQWPVECEKKCGKEKGWLTCFCAAACKCSSAGRSAESHTMQGCGRCEGGMHPHAGCMQVPACRLPRPHGMALRRRARMKMQHEQHCLRDHASLCLPAHHSLGEESDPCGLKGRLRRALGILGYGHGVLFCVLRATGVNICPASAVARIERGGGTFPENVTGGVCKL